MLNMLNGLSTPLVLLVIVGAGVCLGGIFFVSSRLRRRLKDGNTQRQERKLRDEVSRKASASGRWMAEPEEDLTDSGVSSVLEMMDSLLRQGNFEMAEKWALKAIRNHTGRVEIPLRLAQLYFSAGRKARFIAISQYLHSEKFELSETQWQQLRKMGHQIAPEHPLFATDVTDCEAVS